MRASVSSGAVTGAATKTILAVLSAADRRPRLKQIVIGSSDGTPVDKGVSFILRRITTDGTGTAVTPMPLDPSDGATPTCTAKKNYTIEPTYATGTLHECSLHQRATGVFEPPAGFDWACAIGSGPGLGLQQVSSVTTAFNVSFVWDE